MTLTKTIKYALFITFFAFMWATLFQVVMHKPMAGEIVYWSVGLWGLLIFLFRSLENKGKKV